MRLHTTAKKRRNVIRESRSWLRRDMGLPTGSWSRQSDSVPLLKGARGVGVRKKGPGGGWKYRAGYPAGRGGIATGSLSSGKPGLNFAKGSDRPVWGCGDAAVGAPYLFQLILNRPEILLLLLHLKNHSSPKPLLHNTDSSCCLSSRRRSEIVFSASASALSESRTRLSRFLHWSLLPSSCR